MRDTLYRNGLTMVEEARRAFLLTVTKVHRDGLGPIDPTYLEEKVQYIFRARRAGEVRGILDLERQRVFDQIMAERVERTIYLMHLVATNFLLPGDLQGLAQADHGAHAG